ncbi:MAG TPA: DUF952 domain-containing protein [Streptosporangiaceae bacterium]|nr:DUF952 domain-containing protein [Streptosporangiaceae bacterium]
MEFIYHIATQPDWEEATETGEYRTSTRGKTLDDVGFIHASTHTQVAPVANAVYQGQDHLVVLVIDPGRVHAEIRYEPVQGWETPFPHIYGPLNSDAVVRTLPFEPDAQGYFHFTVLPPAP